MLVLSRGCDTAIYIGSDITVRVLGIHRRQVTLGIQAPSGLSVWREELLPVVARSQSGVEKHTCRSQQQCFAQAPRRRS